jgi:serine/threonine-protein kinase
VICPATGKSLDRSIHRAPQETAHSLVGSIIGGRYRVVRVIGAGGTSEVLEAENVTLRRPVAVKIVKNKLAGTDAAERLQREAQFVAAIQHPNICDVLDVGTLPDGRPFIVLERLFGESLALHLGRARGLDVAWAKELFTQILSGLHAAHGAGIVHRDLKPQNVFLVDRLGCPPLAKLVDFGFAKDVSGTRGATMTKPGKVVGTPTYMAPEQLAGERVDRRADVFAVGVMLHEALAGRHPFMRATNAEIVTAILREDPPPLRQARRDVTAALEVVVRRALAKEREARWPTAFDMQRALFASAP